MSSIASRLLKSAKVLFAAAALTGLAAPAPLSADVPAAPASQPTDPFGGKDRSQGVTVPESIDAMSKFELAKRMIRLRDWPKAADALQEVLDVKFRTRLVPSQLDADNFICLYASVAEAAENELAKWPLDGLNVYRSRFEPQASALLEQVPAGDIPALNNVFSLYFATDSGKQAGLRLIDLYLEDGQFLAAAGTGEKLLRLHPNLDAERPKVIYRTAIAYHLMGNASADQFLEELKDKHADATGMVAGKDVTLADALAKQLQEKTAAPAAAPDSWVTFGGNAEHNLVPDIDGRVGGRVWSLALPEPAKSNVRVAGNPTIINARAMQARGPGITIMPVVDRGELFFHNGQYLFARSLETGVPLPGWAKTYGNDGRYSIALAPGDPNFELQMAQNQISVTRQHTLTVTDKLVLAVMGNPDITSIQYAMGFGGQPNPGRPPANRGTKLVCLDRESGREKWSTSAAQIQLTPEQQKDQPGLNWVNLAGAPLVVGNNVYVLGRGGAGQDECYAICFDLESGKYRWSSFLASSSGNGYGAFGMGMGYNTNAIAHLAYSSGRIYVLSNLGAAAALDAYNGGIVWLAVYPRNTGNDNNKDNAVQPQARMIRMRQMPSPAASDPWSLSPPIVQDGKLFVLPDDGAYLMVYDAATGNEVKRIDLDRMMLDTRTKDASGSVHADTLLAAMGNKVIVAGESDIACIDWVNWSEKAWEVEKKAYLSDENPAKPIRVWQHPFSISKDGQRIGIRGRCFVTSRSVLIPTEKCLSVLDTQKEGFVFATYPKSDMNWPSEEGPGNMLVTQDYVVVATAKAINVYTDLGAIRRKFEGLLAKEPNSIDNWLKYSEILFNAGELKDSMTNQAKAIELLGGMNAMRAGQQRDQVFADAITFAEKLKADLKGAPGKEITELYQRAAAAATTPGQHVNYRMSWATFASTIAPADEALAVKLYQEILSQKDLRDVPVASGENELPRRAADSAETKIDLLIKSKRETYALYEKAAGELLETLKAKNDPTQLYTVAEQYPNSQAAPQALMLAAERYETGGNPRQAAQVLRSLLRRYNDNTRLGDPEKAKLLEAIARVYLKLGNPKVAFARLKRNEAALGQTALSQPLTLADGKPLTLANGQQPRTFKEAAEALDKTTRELDVQALPELRLPEPWKSGHEVKPFRPETVIPDIASLVLPPRENPEASRYDRIVAFAEGKVVCYAVGETKPRWAKTHLVDAPKGGAWVGSKLLVWSGGEVALLDDDHEGQLVWKNEIKNFANVEIVASGPPSGDSTGADDGNPNVSGTLVIDDGMAVQAIQQRVVINGRVRFVGAGAVARGLAVPPPAAGGADQFDLVRALSDRVILTTTQGRAICLNLSDGKEAWKTRLARNPISRLVANDDFAVMGVNDQGTIQLIAVDSFDGQQVYRRTFNQNNPNTQGIFPQTFALAPDGTLVWMTYQGLTAKDLYDPATRALWNTQPGQLAYQANGNPDQFLLIAGQQVIAVCNNGTTLDTRDLRTGNATKAPINIGANDGTPNMVVALRLAGPVFFFATNKAIYWDNLQTPGDKASEASIPPDAPANFVDVLVGRDYVVAINARTNNGVADNTNYQLPSYWRKLIPRGDTGKLAESALLGYNAEIRAPSGVLSWQAVDGGLYYLTRDSKLHILMGARE